MSANRVFRNLVSTQKNKWARAPPRANVSVALVLLLLGLESSVMTQALPTDEKPSTTFEQRNVSDLAKGAAEWMNFADLFPTSWGESKTANKPLQAVIDTLLNSAEHAGGIVGPTGAPGAGPTGAPWVSATGITGVGEQLKKFILGVSATGITGVSATGITGVSATGYSGVSATGIIITGFSATGITGFSATGITGFSATGITGVGPKGAFGFGPTGAPRVFPKGYRMTVAWL
ncbi:hypothetical protein COCOBI_09-0290 [Coccomyxa sp. Obi]|nr:hypothetical protein COCOBI_09-0290 [Coccomyxa sp. Obi]